MPYVNIKLTGDSEAPTPEQKEQLIAGVPNSSPMCLARTRRIWWSSSMRCR